MVIGNNTNMLTSPLYTSVFYTPYLVYKMHDEVNQIKAARLGALALLSARSNELLERVDWFNLPGFNVALDPA